MIQAISFRIACEYRRAHDPRYRQDVRRIRLRNAELTKGGGQVGLRRGDIERERSVVSSNFREARNARHRRAVRRHADTGEGDVDQLGLVDGLSKGLAEMKVLGGRAARDVTVRDRIIGRAGVLIRAVGEVPVLNRQRAAAVDHGFIVGGVQDALHVAGGHADLIEVTALPGGNSRGGIATDCDFDALQRRSRAVPVAVRRKHHLAVVRPLGQNEWA